MYIQYIAMGERGGERGREGGKEREERRGRKGEKGKGREGEKKGEGGKGERVGGMTIHFFVMCRSNHLTDVHLDLLFLLLNFHLQLLNIFTKFANL